MRWLEPFQCCFGHRAQRLALQTYVQGVFSDNERKSMQAMLTRVTEPVSYHAFQHFITHAPWDADRISRRLLKILPERRGVLILDGTSFPKQGLHSVGLARQYCGAPGKIANCQVAVTAARWTGTRAWLLGALLYLPQSWIEDAHRRGAAGIPARASFEEKWRQALTLIRRARAAGLRVTAVVADAEFGEITAFRRTLHSKGGVSDAHPDGRRIVIEALESFEADLGKIECAVTPHRRSSPMAAVQLRTMLIVGPVPGRTRAIKNL